MIPMKKEEFGYYDILGDLLGPGERLFHRPHPHGHLKSDKGSEIPGWTSPHGKCWDRGDIS